LIVDVESWAVKNLGFISENYVMKGRMTDSDRSAYSNVARCSRRVSIENLDFSERRDRASWGMGDVVLMITRMEENKRVVRGYDAEFGMIRIGRNCDFRSNRYGYRFNGLSI